MEAHMKSSNPLAENLEEIGQSVKKMLELIENGESLSKKTQLHGPEPVAHIEEFYHLYQSLAERFDRFSGEFRKIKPSEFQLLGYGNSKPASTQDSPLHTPHQKPGPQPASSISGSSSDFSSKDGAELSSSSSSDSESESLYSVNVSTPLNIDAKELHENIVELGTVLQSMKDRHQEVEGDKADSLLEVGENGSYQVSHGNSVKFKQNLRVSNPKLQFSEEEVARLTSELHVQIESAHRDIRMREDDLELERRQVIELRNYTTELETHVSESNFEIKRLMKELEASKGRLKESEEEIERLKTAVANEISEGTNQLEGRLKLAQEDVVTFKAMLDAERRQVLNLQERIAKYKRDLSNHNDEIRELKVAFSDAQKNFSLEKAQLQSDMISLLEKQNLSVARLKERELQDKALEDKIKRCESDKREMKGLHEAQVSEMQSEINRLNVEVAERGSHVEALNKNFDALKLKYDMLMAEKDEFRAKVNTLMAQVSSRDNCIRQTEECLRMLNNEREQLIAGDIDAKKVVDELRVRVKELEKEVDRQRIVISDGAEEKREAIRQLCFSLEHFRSGYKELREAVLGLGYKKPAVMAA